MILALDVGNSQIYAGVFEGDVLKSTFRKASTTYASSDELGLFLVVALRENKIDPEHIRHIAICSVVPDLVYTLRNCCKKYFDRSPFILQSGVKTGFKIAYRNPLEVGSDRIANAIGAAHLFPDKNLIIIDYGTATTIDAVTRKKEYLGGMIVPGLRISMEALESKTAKLPAVEILKPQELIGRSTVESIQAGLYFGNVAIAQELTRKIKKEYFPDGDTVIIGTGGFSRLFTDAKIFDTVVPDLVLIGLQLALKMNV
jgi:type III pantothenate kinase